MRITILTPSLTNGGAERVATLWAKGFVDRGEQVSVVLNTDEQRVSYQLPEEIRVYNIYKRERRIMKELGIGMVHRLRKVLIESKPDIIICVLSFWVQLAWRASWGMNIPIIDTEHNAFERPKEAPMYWRERINKFVFSKLASHITVLTKADYNIISKCRKNVSVLPNPLPYKSADVVPMKERLILACGRMEVWYTKGFDLLIEAWGKIAMKHPEWCLTIAGSGPKSDIQYLNCLAKKCNLVGGVNISFVGWQEDMLSLYQRASVFVLSSRFEGFGMVLTEAMSQGCACIAADYKGRQKEIVSSGKDGVIIPPNSSEALAVALEELINNESLRIKLQKAAITRSRDFSIENIMSRWYDIFQRMGYS